MPWTDYGCVCVVRQKVTWPEIRRLHECIQVVYDVVNKISILYYILPEFPFHGERRPCHVKRPPNLPKLESSPRLFRRGVFVICDQVHHPLSHLDKQLTPYDSVWSFGGCEEPSGYDGHTPCDDSNRTTMFLLLLGNLPKLLIFLTSVP